MWTLFDNNRHSVGRSQFRTLDFGTDQVQIIEKHAEDLKDEQRNLSVKHAHDTEQMLEKYTNLALSLPEKYVSKDDFKTFAERMNDRFDRLEEKIDSLSIPR